MTPSEPIDELHAMCLEARDAIRRHVRVLRALAAEWEPRPCPPRWRR